MVEGIFEECSTWNTLLNLPIYQELRFFLWNIREKNRKKYYFERTLSEAIESREIDIFSIDYIEIRNL